jgi:hypothetical protein
VVANFACLARDGFDVFSKCNTNSDNFLVPFQRSEEMNYFVATLLTF